MNSIVPLLRRAAGAVAVQAARLAAVAALIVVALPAGAADTASETRTVGTFRTVRLIGSADLVLKQGEPTSLVVEGDRDTLKKLTAETRGDELVLGYETRGTQWFSGNSKGARFVLTVKSLDRITTSGSGDIQSDSFTVPGDFEIAVAGSSDVKFGALAARKLLVRISGSGDLTLAGGVLEQNVRIAGSGDYHCANLQSASATIAISGAGDATLWARDSLSVKIAGTGDVKYYGRPTVSKSIAGIGSVTGLGDKP